MTDDMTINNNDDNDYWGDLIGYVATKKMRTTYALWGRRGGVDVGGVRACLFSCDDENGCK
jgi:hypothetical protein